MVKTADGEGVQHVIFVSVDGAVGAIEERIAEGEAVRTTLRIVQYILVNKITCAIFRHIFVDAVFYSVFQCEIGADRVGDVKTKLKLAVMN